VLVDDELAGTSPVKVMIAAGHTVRIRAEFAGHAPAEDSRVVGDRAETFRLALKPLVATAPPLDAGTGAKNVRRPGGRRQPTGRDTPSETKPDDTRAPASGSGSTFDPENIAH